VDHGKSTLVERMTGINPDRLKEEQERQMTIDLGFAWMDLPNGEVVGIIDVPGHRDFIGNMLAGVGGIDAGMLVVAADEGVMPQTREHLAILDLLEVNNLVVALTKVDLVDDETWLSMVREDIAATLGKTRFAGARIVDVSAVSGHGLSVLIDTLSAALEEVIPKSDLGRPRLPIDRAFTIAGFGTVVTGTLVDGSFQVGDGVVLLPSGRKGRIRNLQTHRTSVKQAIPGSRVAANITGIDVGDAARGDVVCKEGDYDASRLLDAHIRLLKDSPSPIKHNQNVKIFIGAAQRMARVRLMGSEQINAGEDGWIQLVLDQPVVAARGDRYIMRRPSPGATLGGGQIASANPDRLYRRNDEKALKRLEGMLHGAPAEVIRQVLLAGQAMPLKEVVDRSGLDSESAMEAIKMLAGKGEMILLEDREIRPDSSQFVIGRNQRLKIVARLKDELGDYHRKYPLRVGMGREELKSRVKMDSKPYALILESAGKDGDLEFNGTLVWNAGHKPTLTAKEQKDIDALERNFRDSKYSPPSAKESLEAVGEELMGYLLSSGGWMVRISKDVVYQREVYEQMVSRIREELMDRKTISVADVRDLFKTSRKYALALMEHLDEIGVTVREGDIRRLA
jgi:selenocysteine-specific elongation factor